MISIIIPVYNVAQYLDECIASVVKQTYTDWECILVDDGSTDDSGEITIAIGLLWRIINGNKILKVVMSPWFWVNARLDVK